MLPKMRRAGPPRSVHLGICHVFYETRVLMGRDMTLQRFAREVLGGEIEAVMLGYIEKGERIPRETLVRRLAEVRQEPPEPLLALLARDRMLRAVGKELRKLLATGGSGPEVGGAALALHLSRAITLLPEDGGWTPRGEWRSGLGEFDLADFGRPSSTQDRIDLLERTLVEQKLVELDGERVRCIGHHYQPEELEARISLASEYTVLFLKGLVDRLAFPEETGTYMRNHYLHIDPARMPEFQADLDRVLRELARRYGEDASGETEFLNILTTATSV